MVTLELLVLVAELAELEIARGLELARKGEVKRGGKRLIASPLVRES